MANCGTFQKLRPLSLLAHLSSCYDSARLQVSSNSVSWSIYLEQGKIVYASHSVDPFDRLDRHLRYFSHKIPSLSSETREQLRLIFETDLESQSGRSLDYQAICWLVDRQYLNLVQATALIERLVREVIESFLLVGPGTYELEAQPEEFPEFCRLDLQPIIEHCQQQLQGWQSLNPQIWSPDQRPYYLNRTKATQQLPLELQQKLAVMVKRFSFRHLAVLLNQDELQLAQSLHPYIVDGTVSLHEPHPPFNQLPFTAPHPELPKQIQPLRGLERSRAFDGKVEEQGRMSDFSRLPPSPSVPKGEPETLQPQRKSSPPSSYLSIPPVPGDIEISYHPNGEQSHPANPKTLETAPPVKGKYKIVCVDDSPTMLREIDYFLDDESFSVFTIDDSIKALMQIIRLKPDLVLLDVRMSKMDGYELCRLLRNHSLFKLTPIIMVTGNTGIIDRVKARLVGASGYLTKPFTQSDLLKIMFRHLT